MSEWTEAIANLTDTDWQRILDLNRRIQSHTRPWGETAGGERIEPNVITMPYAINGPLITEFSELWYEKELVIPFDWGSWEEGREWFRSDEPLKYDRLDMETALKLITALLRNDRFSEGALLRAFESGVIPHILKRIVEIHYEQ